ncbi:hypothetical protein, partial [Mesorhizobium sp.]|uniref:hypothetical protein n=1 Tax=Mesorhizobium sp. TaxID=1871066 RepID=UPI0025C007B8
FPGVGCLWKKSAASSRSDRAVFLLSPSIRGPPALLAFEPFSMQRRFFATPNVGPGIHDAEAKIINPFQPVGSETCGGSTKLVRTH